MSAASYRLIAQLPCQVAAVCYRHGRCGIEFLLVKTDAGKWTFPKGRIEPHLSHRQAAANEAREEAGAVGDIARTHFHVYLHSKGVFWKPPGIREFAVKAYLLQVSCVGMSEDPSRCPTWFVAEAAKTALARRREVKYSRELHSVIDAAVRRILAPPPSVPLSARLAIPGNGARNARACSMPPGAAKPSSARAQTAAAPIGSPGQDVP